MTTHSRLAPSSAHRWAACAGSIALEAAYPDTSSKYADEGTAAHELASIALSTQLDAVAYLHRLFEVNGQHWEVTPDMASNVQQYLDYVRGIDGKLLFEQRLSIAHITGEEGAGGTADAVVVTDNTIVIVDLKYGRGVKVEAQHNEQLAIYGAAALAAYGHELIKHVRMVIVQPRLGHISEWSLSTDRLNALMQSLRPKAAKAISFINTPPNEVTASDLTPAPRQCRFCKAKASCPALTSQVLSTVADEFTDLTLPPNPPSIISDNVTLGRLFGYVAIVEAWCKSIRERARSELLAGRPVPGLKLVQGRRGVRRWTNEAQAELMLKASGLLQEELYNTELVSPTAAERLHKAGYITPQQWQQLNTLITKPDAAPALVAEDDIRPALAPPSIIDDFADLTLE